MSPKRPLQDVEEVIKAIPLPPGWVNTLVTHPDIAAILAHIAQQAGVTDNPFKRSKLDLPSLSRATWEDVSTELNLPPSPGLLNLRPRFSPPACFLPPSLHKAMFQAGWQAMDVYQEIGHQDREAARVKLFEPVSHQSYNCRVAKPTTLVAHTYYHLVQGEDH